MDKLAKMFYNDKSMLFKYKGDIEIPVLGMLDDLLNVAKCSNQVVTTTATINSFMELNKLKLAHKSVPRFISGKRTVSVQ